MKIPFSGYLTKFSATLSTIMHLLKSLPILLRSLIKDISFLTVCYLNNLFSINLFLSIVSTTQVA